MGSLLGSARSAEWWSFPITFMAFGFPYPAAKPIKCEFLVTASGSPASTLVVSNPYKRLAVLSALAKRPTEPGGYEEAATERPASSNVLLRKPWFLFRYCLIRSVSDFGGTPATLVVLKAGMLARSTRPTPKNWFFGKVF